MRISLLTYSTRPRGGVVHTLALAEALAAGGDEVSVWTLGRGGDAQFFRPVDASVRVRVVPFEARDGEPVGVRIVRSIDAMRAAFEPDGADIVHAEDCITANAVPGSIRTVHHLDAFTTPELVRCHDAAVREPTALVTVSAAVAREVRDTYGRAATVIPNGVDAARFAAAAGPGGADARAAWHARFGSYVLAVGGIEPRKGTIDALDGFALARQTHPELRFVIAGGETLFDYSGYRRAFDERAAALGVPVELLGPVAHDDVPSLVAAAAALPFVSTKEGFGLAAMEALAAGVPVIARDLPVVREVFDDAVRRVPDDASIAARLALEIGRVLAGDAADPAAGRALAASYTWEAAAAAHRVLYRDVLASRATVP